MSFGTSSLIFGFAFVFFLLLALLGLLAAKAADRPVDGERERAGRHSVERVLFHLLDRLRALERSRLGLRGPGVGCDENRKWKNKK